MDKGFIEGQVTVVRDQTEQWDFIVRTQDGDYHVDFDDGYYHQCVSKKLDGKTVRLGYYSIETNPDGTGWVQVGDDNTLQEMKTDEPLEEDEPPRRILKRPSRTINNIVKEVRKEEKKEVTAVKKMEDQKQEKPQRRKVFFKIIVPNYNNYIYIKKCLDSIKEQTFKNYVCIVVDDLSTDDSFKIAQIYAKRDPEHFVAIKVDKKGHEGGARNKGIDYPIDCEYYYFVDSDDYLYNDRCLEKLFVNVKDCKIDILLFKMIQLINGSFKPVNYEKFKWDSKTLTFSHGSASSKIVKSNFIEPFLENCDHAADNYQWCKLLDKFPSIKEIDEIIYVYRRTQTSLTGSKKYDSDIQIYIDNMEELRKNLKNKYVINSVDYRLEIERRKINSDKDPINILIKKYNLKEKIKNKQKCIIIGANNSIKDFNAKQYVNNTDKLVIRINRPAQKDMIKCYGERCDLIIGTEYAKKLSDGFPNRINISDTDIKYFSKNYLSTTEKQLTTGFIAILMCLRIFKDVEIFGFGYSNTKEDDIKYKSVHDNWDKTRHLINFEHQLLDDLIRKNKRIKRFEDSHEDIKIIT